MKLIDVVSLKKSIPAEGLAAGERGAIVEDFGDDVMVEFVDPDGQTRAMPVVSKADLLLVWESPASKLDDRPPPRIRKAG